MTRLLRIAVVALLSAALAGPAVATATAASAVKRASVTELYGDLMCVVCNESLAVANSPEAIQERQYVQQLVSQGLTRKQILSDMVQQYGSAVLAKPPAHGFNILVYVIPGVVVLVGLLTLGLVVPRWRARARTPAGTPGSSQIQLSPEDAARLDAELAENR